jgi:parallel beta-helix repeat protein
MTIDEARRILGLKPDEDAVSHLEEFGAARERIAEMVRAAPNDTLAIRYQEGLVEFDQALAALREHLEEKEAQVAPVEVAPIPEAVEVPPAEVAPEQEVAELPVAGEIPGAEVVEPAVTEEIPEPEFVEGPEATAPEEEIAVRQDPATEKIVARGSRRSAVALALLLVLLVGGGGGALIYYRIQADMELQRQSRLVFLERQGAILIENRRWDEAKSVYAEVELINPGSEVALMGRRSIEAGIEEEQNQFIAYWKGAAVAAIEARQWGEAEKALATLVKRLPDSPVVGEIQAQVAEGRKIEVREKRLAEGRRALGEGKWDKVTEVANALLDESPDDTEATDLLSAAKVAAERERKNLERARELFARASKRDQGAFDEQALEWAREAARLAPGDDEIATLYRKLSGYTRTIEVPGDFPTVAAAIEVARERDLVRIGEGTFNESLVIDKPVQLEGAGPGKTVIECAAEEGPVMTWIGGAIGAQASNLELRHRSFTPETERFSVVLIRGGHVLMSDCILRNASGHGVAVIEGGVASLTRCKLLDNGWDGVSVYGDGSRVEARDCEASGNFEHGFDIWDGASAVIRDSAANNNGRNGIFIETPSELSLVSNTMSENREFGLVVAGARGGLLSSNTVERNRLGGIALHRAALGVEIRDNQSKRNLGPGLVLDKGFAAGAFDGNEISSNRSTRQIAKDVTLDAGQDEEEVRESDK